MHLNTKVHKPVNWMFNSITNIKLINPKNYLQFIHLMNHPTLSLTNSSRIQEKVPTLEKPVMILYVNHRTT
ncbi:MAG: UDP-N-acetylglucosamine 2-epimerase [Sodalis sp. Ffu]|nr:MAG: UDP-N-acetylglucosamine 2-epimerase [Sodalis sp. Ffu]